MASSDACVVSAPGTGSRPCSSIGAAAVPSVVFGAVLQQLQHPRDEQGHDDDENDVAAGERSPQQEPHDRERDHDRADEDPVPAQPPAEPAGLETAPASPSFGSWARYVIG